jgi:HEAT repeat protein
VDRVEQLIKELGDEHPHVRSCVARALVEVGVSAVEPLNLLHKDEDEDVRIQAAQTKQGWHGPVNFNKAPAGRRGDIIHPGPIATAPAFDCTWIKMVTW